MVLVGFGPEVGFFEGVEEFSFEKFSEEFTKAFIGMSKTFRGVQENVQGKFTERISRDVFLIV
jgi:hypothetical protein